MKLADAPTPALVLDRGRLAANCERMLGRARALGVGLRPHMKTLKSVDAARMAIDPAHGGIAVSTLREGEYFAAAGLSDIQCALCLAPDKLGRAAALLARAPRFSFFLDSLDMARAVVAHARETAAPLRAWIEIDSGEHRTGLTPDDPVLVEVARVLADPAVVFEGVATHAGQSYGATSIEQIRAVAETERRAVGEAAERIRAAGIAVRGVSAGSSPTAAHAASAQGLTELRAGVYMAGDLYQAALGAQGMDDLAVSVLASVISASPARGPERGPERGHVVIDAGGIALSKDRSTARLPELDAGYGRVMDIAGEASLGDLVVEGVHQEHGEIGGPGPLPFERLAVGAKVRVLPNHVCMTAAAYDDYLVVDGGEEIIARWPRQNGW
ncbi:MAG: alanine racemase [Caulobacteraceae bacterium]|nr:alanine racemase [Caulobacteraceae bacterium]